MSDDEQRMLTGSELTEVATMATQYIQTLLPKTAGAVVLVFNYTDGETGTIAYASTADRDQAFATLRQFLEAAGG